MQIQRSSPTLPATTILQVSPTRPQAVTGASRGQEALLAALRYPPRASQVKPLGDLLPEVLATYGLQDSAAFRSFTSEPFEAVA